MLTEEQAFKIGFLQRCAEDGLTIEETKQRVKLALHIARGGTLEKRAILPFLMNAGTYLGGQALNLGGRALQTVPSLLSTAGTVGLAAPLAAGAGTGYLAAKALTPDNSVVEDAKQDEIMGEYERLADEARRRARLKRLQNETGRRVIALAPGEH
jgi:hypothetical protein